MTLTPKEKLVKAKIKLLRDHPFYSVIVMNMKEKATKELNSFGVDKAGRLYYNEAFLNELDHLEIVGVLVHEAMHVVWSHLMRLGSKEHQLWNIATDIVVNYHLLNEGFTLPSCGIIPNTYENNCTVFGVCIEEIDMKSAEEIYDELLDQKKEMLKNGMPKEGRGTISVDEHIYDTDDSDKELEDKQKEWETVMINASEAAKKVGKMPGSMQRLIDKLLKPKLSYSQVLYNYINSAINSNETWSRESKRSICSNLRLPDLDGEKLNIKVGIDVSGSVSDEEFAKLLSECQSIEKAFEEVEMEIILWDTEVQSTYKVKNTIKSEFDKIQLRGGGGTDVNCLLRHLNKTKDEVEVCIVLTDGYFSKIEEKCSCDLIWVMAKYHSKDAIKESYSNPIILDMEVG